MLSERVLRVVYFWLPERRVSEGRAGSGGVDSCHGTDKHGCNV